jgi:hypothetical protein
MKSYRPWSPTQSFLLPPSPMEWLPEGHLGFRRFSFRGLAAVRAEWALVCATHDLLKLFRSRAALALA